MKTLMKINTRSLPPLLAITALGILLLAVLSCARVVNYSGVVVDAKGSPIPNAKVVVSTWHPAWAFSIIDESATRYYRITDAYGSFNIDEPGSSLYRINRVDIEIVSPENYRYYSKNVMPSGNYSLKSKIGTPGNGNLKHTNYNSFYAK